MGIIILLILGGLLTLCMVLVERLFSAFALVRGFYGIFAVVAALL
jgi:hypothetical protein